MVLTPPLLLLQLYLRDLNKDGGIARKWAAHKQGNVVDPAVMLLINLLSSSGEYVICLYTDDDYVVTCPRGELSSVWRKSALMSNWVALPLPTFFSHRHSPDGLQCASPDCTIRTGITQSVQFDDEILVRYAQSIFPAPTAE